MISSPFHDGLPNVDRGNGPARLLEELDLSGYEPAVEVIAPVNPTLPEAARLLALNHRLARRVRAALEEEAFALVLAGDCNSCVGTVSGCGSAGLGVVWFDTHADFDTPSDTSSGSLDAMGIAMLTGRAWETLVATIPGFSAIAERHVLLVGVRDLEPMQRERLRDSAIAVRAGNTFSRAELQTALDALREGAPRIYLHVDLDSLDPSEGVANQYSAAAGLSFDQLAAAVSDVFDRFEVVAAAVTAYNPAADPDGRMAETGARVAELVVERGARAIPA